MERSSRARRTYEKRRHRLVALGFGLLLGVFLCESGLWLLHVFGRAADRGPDHALADGRRILCVGDSNTYGVQIPAAASYPSQLERMLSASGTPWQVVNLGYPGRNTAQIRANLRADLDRLRPEIVICLAGVNNSWSPAMGHLWNQPDDERPPSLFAALLQRSRLYRLLSMAEHRFDGAGRLVLGDDVVPTVKVPRGAEELRRSIEVDLRRIHAICHARGVDLLLLDYPVTSRFVREEVNGAIHEIARTREVPLVSLRDHMDPLFARYGYETLFPHQHHASELGNYAVARAVLDGLVRAGWVEDHASHDRFLPLPELLETFRLALVRADSERLVLELQAPPTWRSALLVVSEEEFQARIAAGEAPPWDRYAHHGTQDYQGFRTVEVPRSSFAPAGAFVGHVLACFEHPESPPGSSLQHAAPVRIALD